MQEQVRLLIEREVRFAQVGALRWLGAMSPIWLPSFRPTAAAETMPAAVVSQRCVYLLNTSALRCLVPKDERSSSFGNSIYIRV